jgi:hypothetical protein
MHAPNSFAPSLKITTYLTKYGNESQEKSSFRFLFLVHFLTRDLQTFKIVQREKRHISSIKTIIRDRNQFHGSLLVKVITMILQEIYAFL